MCGQLAGDFGVGMFADYFQNSVGTGADECGYLWSDLTLVFGSAMEELDTGKLASTDIQTLYCYCTYTWQRYCRNGVDCGSYCGL